MHWNPPAANTARKENEEKMRKIYLLALQMILGSISVYGMEHPDNLNYNSVWKDEAFFYSFERNDDILDIEKFKGGWYGYGYFEESGSGSVMLDAGVYLFQVGADDEATLTIDGVTSEIRGTHAITWGNWARLDVSSKRLCQYDWTFNNRGRDLYELDYQFWRSKAIPFATITMDGFASSGPVIGRVKVSEISTSSPPTAIKYKVNGYSPDVTYSVSVDEEAFSFIECNIVTSNGIGEIVFHENLVYEQVNNGNKIISLRLYQSYKGLYDNSRTYQIELYTDDSHYSAPTNLEATQYHNQHPQGVKLTWSPVAGAPGYVILRKIVGENEFYPVGATPDTEYINKVATIPNVKDFKAQYAVAVADWQGNDPNTIVYLSPWSKAEWGCWREDPPPTVEHRPPRVIGMVKSNANPMLSGVKDANVYTIEFNDDYDKSGYAFKQARIIGVHNGKRYDFTSAKRSVTVDIPAGEHGPWSFEGRAVFTETASGKEYTTEPPYILTDKVRFDRAGHDGVKVGGVRVRGSFDKVPNWFKYWKRDWALVSLGDENVYYDGRPWYDTKILARYSDVYSKLASSTAGGWTHPADGKVYIRDNAIINDYSGSVYGRDVSLHTANASCLLKCAEVVKHESEHSRLVHLRKVDASDYDKDGLPDSVETSCSFLPFEYNNPYTFAFRWNEDGQVYYNQFDDEEIYVRYLATKEHDESYFNYVVRPDEDYSWAPEDVPVRRGKAMLSSSVESLLATSSAESWNSGALDDVAFFSGVVEQDSLVVVQGVKSITTTSVNSGDYSSLDICVTCAASTNMPCAIVASLTDENGEPVAWASWTGYVDEGENDVTLKVDGSVLRESGKNGYTVASVSVFDIRSIELMEPIAYAAVNYVSSTQYKWSDFWTDNVTIQSLALLEADGRVRVDAEIVVPNEDGVYDLSSYLCDVGTHDYVAEASQTNVVLHAGTNAVSLAFANSDIQMNAFSNAFAISKFTVEKDGEIVAAYNGGCDVERGRRNDLESHQRRSGP